MIRQGEELKHTLVLLTGHVKIVIHSEFGRDLLMAVRGPGDLLGEMAVLEDEPRTTNVIACGPTTVRSVKGNDFVDFVHRHPHACLTLARMLSERLRRADLRCADMITCPAPLRVARVLDEVVRHFGKKTAAGWDLGIPLNQPEIASLAGVGLSTVEKALHEWQDRQVLRKNGRRIVIADRSGLRRIGELPA
jgi:CRP-like cAMP-binding protein